jgi:hypothetical protein
VGIEQCQAFTSGKVLLDEVEQQRALAGAGLADDVEVAAAFLGVEHDGLARNDVGAKANRLCCCRHSRRRAGVPCASQFGK